jgi:hypothetical protein
MIVTLTWIVGGVIILATLAWLAAPVLFDSYERRQREIRDHLFLVKLRIVRKCYPDLQEMTYSEILETYDVDALYDDIGRSPFSTVP